MKNIILPGKIVSCALILTAAPNQMKRCGVWLCECWCKWKWFQLDYHLISLLKFELDCSVLFCSVWERERKFLNLKGLLCPQIKCALHFVSPRPLQLRVKHTPMASEHVTFFFLFGEYSLKITFFLNYFLIDETFFFF